jgi:hypothetical protein
MTPFRAVIVIISLLAASCAGVAPATPAPSATPSTSATAPPSPSVTASSAYGSPEPSASPPPSSSTAPSIDPANFTSKIDNPWFPLIPGTTFTYRGTKDNKRAVDVYTVTSRTQVIAGVTCVVVDDRLTLDGVLAEKTTDYYVQDRTGNVWYFGEDTAELDANGRTTSTEGTWHAGVDGAVPGIVMEATPTVGHALAQEFYKGHAEDHFEVISLSTPTKVPYGAFSGALRTKEWTPLEPDVLDNKYYVRGIGEVKEIAVRGPVEELVLVSVK